MINLYDLGCYDMKKHLTLLSLLALAGCSAFEQNSDGIAYSHKDIPLQKNQLQANDGNAVIADSNGEFIASGNILKHPPNRDEQHNLKINGVFCLFRIKSKHIEYQNHGHKNKEKCFQRNDISLNLF